MIRVILEDGTPLAPTYERRARGLVRSGRAKWTSLEKNEICLLRACPTEDISEDNKMDIDNEKMNVTEETGAATVQTEIDEQTWREITGGKPDGEPESKPEYTVEYILSRMEAIRKDTAHINAALEAFVNFTPNLAPDGGHGDAERSKAILEVVKSHEGILEKELDLLERMYDDLKKSMDENLRTKDESPRMKAYEKVFSNVDLMNTMSQEACLGLIKEYIDESEK